MTYFKCGKCGEESAARTWIQIFGSLSAAQMHGEGPEFLSALMPGPGALKIEFCMKCSSFNLCMDYTPEEIEELKEHTARHEKRAKTGEDFGKLFGSIFTSRRPE